MKLVDLLQRYTEKSVPPQYEAREESSCIGSILPESQPGLRSEPELPPNLDNWPEAWREAYEERAAIMEFDGGLARADAERAAWERIQHIYSDTS